ncbi:MAG: hypothetical protein AB7F74_05245 [Parvibaculaceae bacterium]
MSDAPTFRTGEEEVAKLLQECTELRHTLRSISTQVSRMELRLKRAFPNVAKQLSESRLPRKSQLKAPTITAAQALAEFDEVVNLVVQGHTERAEDFLMRRSPEDLLLIARELGVTFQTSKPSIQKVKEAVFGKVRESVQLSRHHVREPKSGQP